MCNISTLYINRGIEKGIQKGIKKGAYEERIKMIVSLNKQNVPIEVIAAAAELTVPETEKIIKDNL